MPLINDLNELLDPQTTNDRIIAICRQYGLKDIQESQTANTEYLQSLVIQYLRTKVISKNSADDPDAQKYYLLATLAYRAGWHAAATLVRLEGFDLFAMAPEAQVIPQPVDSNPIAFPPELTDFRLLDLSSGTLATETARLNSYNRVANLSVTAALEILGIRDVILTQAHVTPKFFAAGYALARSPSTLEKIYQSLAHYSQHHIVYENALKTLKTFIDTSNILAFEQFNHNPDNFVDALSLCKAIQSYREKIHHIAQTDIIMCGQWLAEAAILLKRIDDLLTQITAVQTTLPAPTAAAGENPFALSIKWFPEQIQLIRQYCEAASPLIQSIRIVLQRFDDHMRPFFPISAALIACLEAAQGDTYTNEHEQQVIAWYRNNSTRNTPENKAEFEQASQALIPFAASPEHPFNMTLATLEKHFPGSKKNIENYSTCISDVCRTVSEFATLEEQAKQACTIRRHNLTWQKTKIETELAGKVLQVRRLIPENLTTWDTLLTHIHNNCQFGCPEHERRDRLTYLGLATSFSRIDLVIALNTFEQELKTFLKIIEIVGNRDLSYPEGTNNEYTRQRDEAQQFNFREKQHFQLKLAALHEQYQLEIAACRHINKALDDPANVLSAAASAASVTVLPANYGNNYLRRFVTYNLKSRTYQEVWPILQACIQEETAFLAFLDLAKVLLFNPDLSTLHGNSYAMKFTEFQIRYPARINLTALKTLPPAELEAAIAKEKRVKTDVADLRTRLGAWLPHHRPSINTIEERLDRNKELSFQEALTTLNTNIQREYDALVSQYDQLESTYRKCFTFSSPKQEAINQIQALGRYKTAVVTPDIQPIEQYVLLLGAFKKTLDDVTTLPQLTQQTGGGSAAFFKKPESEIDKDLVTVLQKILAAAAPAIVQRGRLSDTLVLDHPMLTTTVEIMRTHPAVAVLTPAAARSEVRST